MASNWRNTREYRLWRVHIIRRDKVCKICGSSQKREAHHLNHSTYFPDERFDVNNGVTLCRKCHTHLHTTYKNSFREKCTKEDYEEFDKLSDYFFEVVLKNLFEKKLVNEDVLNSNKRTIQNKKTYYQGRQNAI